MSRQKYSALTVIFSEMLGLDNIHARSKEATTKDWRKDTRKQKAIFMGDTTHDKDVADAIGADCLLIPNGHQTKRNFKKRERRSAKT